MKKYFLTLLIVLISLCSVCAVAACGHNYAVSHEHVYSTGWTGDTAEHWHAPTCGDTDGVSDRAEHVYTEWIVTSKATCTEHGTRYRTCSVCGYKEMKTVPATGHSYSTEWTTNSVWHWHAPTCGDIDNIKKGGAEHKFTDWKIISATCTESGTMYRSCVVCGYEENIAIQATGHKAVTDARVEATCTETGLTEGSHCLYCKKIFVQQESIEKTDHKYGKYNYTDTTHYRICEVCGYNEKQEDHIIKEGICDVCGYIDTSKHGVITIEKSCIVTEHFIFVIDENVYLPKNMERIAERIYHDMEIVTGLTFDANGHKGERIKVWVTREHSSTLPGQYEDTETGIYPSAFAGSRGETYNEIRYHSEIMMGPVDLLFCNHPFVHELAHTLRFRQSDYDYMDFPSFEEGFASYVEYEMVCYWEKHPESNIFIDTREQLSSETSLFYNNGKIDEWNIPGDFFSKKIEHWLTMSRSEIGRRNGNYAVGRAFMVYLNDRYGKPYGWIKTYQQNEEGASEKLTEEFLLHSILSAYGEEVFDGFYAWLKENTDKFTFLSESAFDLTGLSKITVYPEFEKKSKRFNLGLGGLICNDLCIDLTEARRYLVDYKKKDISDLKLLLSQTTTVQLYDENMKLLSETSGTEFSLTDVYYIVLVGNNTFTSNEYPIIFTGFEN